MIWKNALKYPMLIVGVVLFGIFLTQPETKKYWEKSKRRFIPSTCDAVVDRAQKKAPDNWEMECPGTQLLIINIDHDSKKRNYLKLRQAMYKDLANSLVKLAQISNPETLEYLKNVKMNIKHPQLEITSKTDGQAVVDLLKKKTQADIANHLKLTVRVKEKRID